jgi:1,4-alpha-glucan branching enzyme
VVVIANFSHQSQENYSVGFPREGRWSLRLNSDWQGYSDDFSNVPSTDTVAESGDGDGYAWQGVVHIAPYSVLIFSQETA